MRRPWREAAFPLTNRSVGTATDVAAEPMCVAARHKIAATVAAGRQKVALTQDYYLTIVR
jgi:hypothetical protein